LVARVQGPDGERIGALDARRLPVPDRDVCDPVFPAYADGRPPTSRRPEFHRPSGDRESLATEFRDAGYDGAIIAKVIGHSDENFTRRVYIHTKDSPRFDAIDGDDFAIGAAE
jgi:integrase